MAAVTIQINARDQASPVFRGVIGSLGALSSTMFAFAAGRFLYDQFRALVDVMQEMIGAAFESAGAFQQLEVRFETLLAREMANIENASTIREEWSETFVELTGDQIAALDDLGFAQTELAVKIRAAEQKLGTQIEKFGEGSVEADLAAVALEKLRRKFAETGAEVSALNSEQGQLIRTMRLVGEGSHTAGEFLEAAKGPAQELLQWVRDIALVTPFSTQTLAEVLAMSLAMGMSSDSAKELSVSIGQFAAGMGLGDVEMKRIILNFGQMIQQSKVTKTELRDLQRGALFPATQVLARAAELMGVTTEEFYDLSSATETGGESLKFFFQAFNEIVAEDFPGAMERLLRTWPGLMDAFKDFRRDVIGLEIIKPTLDVISVALSDLFINAIRPENIQVLHDIGLALADAVDTILDSARRLIFNLGTLARVIMDTLGIDLSQLVGLRDLPALITALGDSFAGFLDRINWAAVEQIVQLPPKLAPLKPVLEGLSGWIEKSGQGVLDFFEGFFAVLGAAAILGTVVAIIGAVTGLITPLTILAFAAGILSAAWQGNWFGMRDTIMGVWNEDIKPAFTELYNWLAIQLPIAIGIVTTWFNTQFLPAVETFNTWLGTNLPIAIATATTFFNTYLLPAIQTIIPWWRDHLPVAIGATMGALGLLGGVLGAVAGFIFLTVIPAIKSLVDWFVVHLGPPITLVANYLSQVLWPALKLIGDIILTYLIGAITTLVNWIGAVLSPIITVVSAYFRELWLPAMQIVWGFIINSLLPLLIALADFLISVLGLQIRVVAFYWENLFKPALLAVWSVVNNNIIPVLKTLWEFLAGNLSTTITIFANTVLPALSRALSTVAGWISTLIGRLNDFRDTINGITLPNWITPGSPTPFEMGLRGIVDAMKEVNQNMPTFGNQPAFAFAGNGVGTTLPSRNVSIGNITVNDRATGQELIALLKRELI